VAKEAEPLVGIQKKGGGGGGGGPRIMEATGILRWGLGEEWKGLELGEQGHEKMGDSKGGQTRIPSPGGDWGKTQPCRDNMWGNILPERQKSVKKVPFYLNSGENGEACFMGGKLNPKSKTNGMRQRKSTFKNKTISYPRKEKG